MEHISVENVANFVVASSLLFQVSLSSLRFSTHEVPNPAETVGALLATVGTGFALYSLRGNQDFFSNVLMI
jgi:hypothetical protein